MVAALNISVLPFIDTVKSKIVPVYHSTSVMDFVVYNHHFEVCVILGEGGIKVVLNAEVSASTVPCYHNTHRCLPFDEAYP